MHAPVNARSWLGSLGKFLHFVTVVVLCDFGRHEIGISIEIFIMYGIGQLCLGRNIVFSLVIGRLRACVKDGKLNAREQKQFIFR